MVLRPLFSTRRIVYSDNYYTSMQLLLALRIKGLHASGTVQKPNSHFPRHVLLETKDCTGGTAHQGVSADHTIGAVSSYDSAIVSVISSADAST